MGRVREIRKPTKRRKKSSKEFFSPMIPSPNKVVNEDQVKTSLTMKLEALKDLIPSSTQILKAQTLWNSKKVIENPYDTPFLSSNHPTDEIHPKAQRRLSFINIVDPNPIKVERRHGLRLGRRMSLLGADRRLSLSSVDSNFTNTTKQSRRLSIESLFGGLAHEIADAQPDNFSRRSSMASFFQDSDGK